MDLQTKLSLLGEGAKYDVCSSSASSKASGCGNASLGRSLPSGVCHSFTPDGRCVSLLKVLMTNYCEKDCAYCPNSVGRDLPRARFLPNELADLFLEFYRRNYVEGLFLSSGISHSTARSMRDMLDTAELLRNHHHFGGYIHLKILPGSTNSEIEKAAKLANRISLNMEVPNGLRMAAISKTKNFAGEIMSGISNIQRHVSSRPGVSFSTQFIVGAAGETDAEILSSASNLYNSYGLKRAYFSAFHPVVGTPLERVAATPLVRENRLYQSDFLVRYYGFSLEDLIFSPTGNLDLNTDPKLIYAENHPELFPLEINRAPLRLLLRIPGIGPHSAQKIIHLRKRQSFSSPFDLQRTGAVIKRALPFITIQGRLFSSAIPKAPKKRQDTPQLSLWGST